MKILETERLILREMSHDDFDSLKAVISDKQTMSFYDSPYDDDGVNRWIEWNLENYRNYGFGLFAVILKDTGEFIGDSGVTIQNINGWYRPEIGYHINKKYWRQGFAKEACIAIRDYIFTHTTFRKLYSYLNRNNIASAKTAMSIGMTLDFEYVDKSGEELSVYSITKESWNQKR